MSTLPQTNSKAWIEHWIAAREREHSASIKRSYEFLERHRAFHAAVTRGDWQGAEKIVSAEREHQERADREAATARQASDSQLRVARAVAA